jgi:hypothetical protein
MKLSFIYYVGLSIELAGCSTIRNPAELNQGKPAESLVLKISCNVSKLHELKLQDAPCVVTFSNASPHELQLDRRLFNPLMGLHILDSNGEEIPPVPPSLPSPFNIDDLAVLKQRGLLQVEFSMNEFTIDPLVGPAYRLWFVYDSTTIPYSSSPGMYKGKVESNLVLLKKKGGAWAVVTWPNNISVPKAPRPSD